VGTVHDAGQYANAVVELSRGVPRGSRKLVDRRTGARRVRRASMALALSRLEREHVALLLALCELEGEPSGASGNARTMREALLPLLREDLRQAQHALARAAQGLYGICEECHRPLAPRTLELKPSATRCPVCEARARHATRD
jgi:DnaK suppressor protein